MWSDSCDLSLHWHALQLVRLRYDCEQPSTLYSAQFEKTSRRLVLFIIVKVRAIEVSYFLIKFSLRKAYFTDILQMTLEIFIRKHMPILQSLLVQDRKSVV